MFKIEIFQVAKNFFVEFIIKCYCFITPFKWGYMGTCRFYNVLLGKDSYCHTAIFFKTRQDKPTQKLPSPVSYFHVWLPCLIMLIFTQIIKLQTWEASFEKKIKDLRKEEVKMLKYSTYLMSLSDCIHSLLPFLVSNYYVWKCPKYILFVHLIINYHNI